MGCVWVGAWGGGLGLGEGELGGGLDPVIRMGLGGLGGEGM